MTAYGPVAAVPIPWPGPDDYRATTQAADADGHYDGQGDGGPGCGEHPWERWYLARWSRWKQDARVRG